MRRIFVVVVVAFTLGGNTISASASRDDLQVSLSAAAVSFARVTAGGKLVVLGMAVHPGPTLVRHRFAEVLTDDDRDGYVAFEPRGGIPLRSVWIAADLTNGAISVTVPEEYTLDHLQMDVKALKRDAEGLVTALEVEELAVDFLLVRPGDGAWLLRAYEGGARDRDGVGNARLTVEPGDAEQLGGISAAAPKKLKSGDILITLDPVRLTVRTLTLTK